MIPRDGRAFKRFERIPFAALESMVEGDEPRGRLRPEVGYPRAGSGAEREARIPEWVCENDAFSTPAYPGAQLSGDSMNQTMLRLPFVTRLTVFKTSDGSPLQPKAVFHSRARRVHLVGRLSLWVAPQDGMITLYIHQTGLAAVAWMRADPLLYSYWHTRIRLPRRSKRGNSVDRTSRGTSRRRGDDQGWCATISL